MSLAFHCVCVFSVHCVYTLVCTACFVQGKCNRRDPPCKYLHPPAHLKEQLLQNGRNNLVARSMAVQMQQMQFLQQLSANPTGSAASLPVVYSSSGALTNVPQTMLASASQLYVRSLFPLLSFLSVTISSLSFFLKYSLSFAFQHPFKMPCYTSFCYSDHLVRKTHGARCIKSIFCNFYVSHPPYSAYWI